MRAVLIAIAAALAAGAAVLAALRCFPMALGLGFWVLLLLCGLVFERWRYQRLGAAPPGPGWQATGERFIDPETGRPVTVYFHPTTGERRYIAG